MTTLRIVLALCALASPALAAENEKSEYFFGRAQVINLSAPVKSDKTPLLLLKKSTIPQQSLMVEKATTLDDTGKVKDHVVYLKVNGQTLTITDADDSIEGTGKVSGEPWNWNLLHFSMVTKRGGIRIEDVNYRTPDRLIARKTLFLQNGQPFMLWEVDAREIPRAEYETRYAEMHAHRAVTRNLR